MVGDISMITITKHNNKKSQIKYDIVARGEIYSMEEVVGKFFFSEEGKTFDEASTAMIERLQSVIDDFTEDIRFIEKERLSNE